MRNDGNAMVNFKPDEYLFEKVGRWHRQLGRKNQITPNRSQTYDLVVTKEL